MFRDIVHTKVGSVKFQIRWLRSALDKMRLDIGRYPTSEEGLPLLLTPPQDEATRQRWHGPYIEALRPPLDDWGHPFHYSPVGRAPNPITLYSDGPPGDPPGPVIGYPPPH